MYLISALYYLHFEKDKSGVFYHILPFIYLYFKYT